VFQFNKNKKLGDKMKSLSAQIEDLINEKAEEHIDVTHSYYEQPRLKRIAVQKLVESVTKDMAEKLVEQFAMPTIQAHI